MKHSRPDIAHATQELSKVINGVNQATFFERYWVMKHVLDTRSLGLKLEPKES